MLFGGGSGGVLLRKVGASFEIEILSPLLACSPWFVWFKMWALSFLLLPPRPLPTTMMDSYPSRTIAQINSSTSCFGSWRFITAMEKQLIHFPNCGPQDLNLLVAGAAAAHLLLLAPRVAQLSALGLLHPSPLGMTVTQGNDFYCSLSLEWHTHTHMIRTIPPWFNVPTHCSKPCCRMLWSCAQVYRQLVPDRKDVASTFDLTNSQHVIFSWDTVEIMMSHEHASCRVTIGDPTWEVWQFHTERGKTLSTA